MINDNELSYNNLKQSKTRKKKKNVKSMYLRVLFFVDNSIYSNSFF